MTFSFNTEDASQVCVGAFALAVPVAFSEEAWHLGETLPVLNLAMLFSLSLLFLGVFTYHSVFQQNISARVPVFIFRIVVAYLLTALVVFLVLLEFPALVIGVLLARGVGQGMPWGRVLHEVLSGKSILLLVGGLLIGWVAGPQGIAPLDRLFFDLFKGFLAFFLLEMGLVVAGRLADLRRAGAFLVGFALLMPLVSGLLGIVTGEWLGLSVAGTALLATLYASASYIAAPAAMRIAVPEANPALSIGAALGVTFPFNLLLGIPVYHLLATMIDGGVR